MNNNKNSKIPPVYLLSYVKFENGEIVALPTMPFYLKPFFNKFKNDLKKQKNKISDSK